MENPKITTNVNLSLIKQRIGTTDPLSDAKFSVADANGNKIIDGISTGADGKLKILDNVITTPGDYVYTISEDVAPEGYSKTVTSAQIKITVGEDSSVKAIISSITLGNGSRLPFYDITIHKKYIYIESSNNNFVIHWYNTPVKYKIELFKRAYTKETTDLSSLQTIKGTTFEITENGIAKEFTNSDDKLIYENTNATTNSTYTYNINETIAATDYNNDFKDVNVVVNLKVDNQGLLSKNESNIDITAKNGYTLSDEEKTNLMKKLNLDVDTWNNVAKINIADTQD